MSLKQRVLRFIRAHPNFARLDGGEQNRALERAFPDANEKTLRSYKLEWREDRRGDRPAAQAVAVPAEVIPGGSGSPPQPAIPDFPQGDGGGGGDLDLAGREPPELLEEGLRRLLRAATRNLGARDPDPRWGQLIYRLAEGAGRVEGLAGGGDEEWLSSAREKSVEELAEEMLGGDVPDRPPTRSGTSQSGPSGGTSSPSGTSSVCSGSRTDSRGGSSGTSGRRSEP